MQGDGSRLTTSGQQLPDILHVGLRLVFRWKLLQRDKRRCQSFRQNPFVVACNSLFGHQPIPTSCQSLSASSRSDRLRSEQPAVSRPSQKIRKTETGECGSQPLREKIARTPAGNSDERNLMSQAQSLGVIDVLKGDRRSVSTTRPGSRSGM